MRNRIVVKLFLLTSGLCILILASIFIGQTILFEDYYANNKMNQLSQAVDSFIVDYQKLDEDEIRRQEPRATILSRKQCMDRCIRQTWLY